MTLKSFFADKKVFITGITGFKGSWLARWLQRMGSEVSGYALEPPTDPSHFSLLNLDPEWRCADIRNEKLLAEAVGDFQPEIVFHLAAQPLVRRSYADPHETFMTNVIGTLNVFEACRACGSVRAIVNITSDKCYENRHLERGYHEDDPMGGYDPYSASKGCAELLTASYRKSYFNPEDYGIRHRTLLASCRAGNVIGGGDWAVDRLIPDVIKAAGSSEVAIIRNPDAVRPWQHVLEPLHGYLLLAEKLYKGETEFAGPWNFGPSPQDNLPVRQVLDTMRKYWPEINYKVKINPDDHHEAALLRLDSSKAISKLNWKPVWSIDQTLEKTAEWYRCYFMEKQIMTDENIDDYIQESCRQ